MSFKFTLDTNNLEMFESLNALPLLMSKMPSDDCTSASFQSLLDETYEAKIKKARLQTPPRKRRPVPRYAPADPRYFPVQKFRPTLPPRQKMIKKISFGKRTKTHHLNKQSSISQPLKQKQFLLIYDFISFLCSQLKFSRATFHQSITLFHQLTRTQDSGVTTLLLTHQNSQLYATTCLIIVGKVLQHDVDLQFLTKVNTYTCTLENIVQCESKILQLVEFRITTGTVVEELDAVLREWDGFVVGVEGVMKREKFLFMGGNEETAVRNYLQVMLLLDRMLVVGDFWRLYSQTPFKLYIIAAIFTILCYQLGQIPFFQQHPRDPKHHPISYTLITTFTSHLLPTSLPLALTLQPLLKQSLSQSPILKHLPQAYNQIRYSFQHHTYNRYQHVHCPSIFK